MKKNINKMLGMLLVAAVTAMPLYGNGLKRVNVPVEHVAKEVSLLDQIVEQASNVIQNKDKRLRLSAKKELAVLVNSLDPAIKEIISGDIGIIQKTTAKSIKASQEAYSHLIDIVAQIDAQANVVEVTKQVTELIKNAPEEEKPGMVGWAYQKIQEAAQAAQRMVTTPVNYVFGEESSNAKTIFYATVGVLMLYGAYRSRDIYDYGSDLIFKRKNSDVRGKPRSPELIKLMESSQLLQGELKVLDNKRHIPIKGGQFAWLTINPTEEDARLRDELFEEKKIIDAKIHDMEIEEGITTVRYGVSTPIISD